MSGEPPIITRPIRYCLECDYPLVSQAENRCPECGNQFDPDDPDTYLEKPTRKPQLVAVLIATYPLPFLMGTFFWTVIGAAKWHRSGNWPPMDARVTASLITGTGPLAWFDVKWTQGLAGMLVASVWLVWLAIVVATPLRRAPVGVHITLSLLWSCCGCMRVSVWV